MSLSCQRATLSSAARAFVFIILAKPVILSDKIGFLLWGIADEPFWPFLNGSSASARSVLCKPRISTANFSNDEATKASTVRYSAWRSL